MFEQGAVDADATTNRMTNTYSDSNLNLSRTRDRRPHSFRCQNISLILFLLILSLFNITLLNYNRYHISNNSSSNILSALNEYYNYHSKWSSSTPYDNSLLTTKPIENKNNGDNSNTNRNKNVPLCPSAIPYLNISKNDNEKKTILEEAYAAFEHYHNNGGSLTAISNYLTSNIDRTFHVHGISSFEPNQNMDIGKISSTSSIVAKVRATLASNDKYNRGGYDQRSLPGNFVMATNHSPDNIKEIIHQGRIIEVIEPFDNSRWDVGLGPIYPGICESLDVIRSKEGQRTNGYDDKFMCSYQSLVKSKIGEVSITSINNSNNNQEDSFLSDSSSSLSSEDVCHIVSIGSNGEWGFEKEVVSSTNCITHTFDCTMNKDPKKPSSENIYFYNICISDKNMKNVEDNRQYATYITLMEEHAKLNRAPTLFKMDVEGFEFSVLTQMLHDAHEYNKMHLLPNQISVELHYASRMYDLPWMLRSITAAEISMFVGMMYRRGGYVLVHHKSFGKGCYPCAEVLFVRMIC